MKFKKWWQVLLTTFLTSTLMFNTTFAKELSSYNENVDDQIGKMQSTVARHTLIQMTLDDRTLSASKKQTVQCNELEKTLDAVQKYLIQKVPNAQVGSIGGEWLIIGLSRYKSKNMTTYYDQYYNKVVSYVKDKKGVLSERKYTEYSRVILALTALGKSPSQVGGYNLLTPLGDYNAVLKQGINGPVFALIALDSGNYEMPVCKTAKVKATREKYINYILSKQLENGGFALNENNSDVDLTAMAVVALAPYRMQQKVNQAINKAITYLSKVQTKTGGYKSGGNENVESASQVLVALNTLGISTTDQRFVKNGYSLIDNILSYYQPGEGFYHTKTTAPNNQMATEQAFYSLVSTWRALKGKSSLYHMKS